MHSRFGLHVVEVLQRDPGQMQPFEVVQDAVAQSLRQQVWVTALRLIGQTPIALLITVLASIPLLGQGRSLADIERIMDRYAFRDLADFSAPLFHEDNRDF